MHRHDKPTTHTTADCWIAGATDKEVREMLDLLRVALPPAINAGAIFEAAMMLAAKVFSMASVEAGDSHDTVLAHIDSICERLRVEFVDQIEIYRVYKGKHDVTH